MDWSVPGSKSWSHNNSHIAKSVPLEDALTEDPIQVMFNGAVHLMRPLAELLRQDARAYSVLMTEYIHRDFALVDVTAPDATKGRALAWRAEQMGLARDEVMAIGDNSMNSRCSSSPAHPWSWGTPSRS